MPPSKKNTKPKAKVKPKAKKEQFSFTLLNIELATELSASGFRRRGRERLVELVLVKHDGRKIIDTFRSLVQPEATIDPFLFTMVNFNEKELAKAPFFADIAEEVLEFIGDSILVGMDVRQAYARLKYCFHPTDFRLQRRQIEMKQLIEAHCGKSKAKSITLVCKDMGFKYKHEGTLLQRSRTMARLFGKLLDDYRPLKKSTVLKLIQGTKRPTHLPAHKVEQLPTATGVYYFLDQKGRIIYLGKSTNIRTRVLSHFNSDLEGKKKVNMKAAIHDIQYRLTGSELIALLLESDEIKRFMPKFNSAQRRKRYKIGLYIRRDEEGFDRLYIDFLGSEERPIMKFTSRFRAIGFILNAASRFLLPLPLCNINHYEEWFERMGYLEEDFILLAEEDAETHNNRVAEMRAYYSYPQANMLIIDEGRSVNERAVILIQDHQYAGYAYLPEASITEKTATDLADLTREEIIPFRENPDVQRIIRGYLRKYEEVLDVRGF